MLLPLQILCNLRAQPVPDGGGQKKKAKGKKREASSKADENYRPIMANPADYNAMRQMQLMQAQRLADAQKAMDQENSLLAKNRFDDQLPLILLMTIH
jgi:hypothetical protein